MKRLTTLAIALILPMLFVSVPSQAGDTGNSSCDAMLQSLIDATKELPVSPSKDTAKTRNKLLKKLYEAQEELAKGTTKHQYHAAKKVWEYDNELRKLYQKYHVTCDDGAQLDESALALLNCIVDVYYPGNTYDATINGVITCP